MTKHCSSIGITTGMIGPLLLMLILLVSGSTAAAYQPPQPHQQRGAATNNSRREYLAGLLTTVAATTVALTSIMAVPVQPANAVLGAGACASGVGEGCGDRSGGNDYIRSLQEKSAVNKDMYERVRTTAGVEADHGQAEMSVHLTLRPFFLHIFFCLSI